MAGQRQPGSWGLEPAAVVIDEGTSIRFETPTPGSVGGSGSAKVSPAASSADNGLVGIAADTLNSLNDAIASFRRSESWAKLQPIVFQVVGHQSFGLGVVYGIGENVIGSVVELAQLAKTFLLADLYDRAHQSSLSAAFGPFAAIQRLMAEVAMRTFGSELEAARHERDELIAELRHAITNLGEVVGNIKDSYVAKWNRFETLSSQRTLSSQFEAGRIFGEVLLEVVSLIGGGAAAARAAAKLPRLARLARLKIPAKSSPRAGGAAAVAEKPAVTPSQTRGPQAPVAEPPPPKPAVSEPVKWGPHNGPGPLGPEVAATFRSGTYTETILTKETTLYRVYGGSAREIGPYWTRTPPAGPLQSTIDSALNPAWGNTAEKIATIRVPAGTTIYEGVAASQGGLVGGGSQVVIRNVNPSWIVK